MAEEAGLTRGAQVHHFGSKHELMTAAMHHMTARTVATVVADFRRGVSQYPFPGDLVYATGQDDWSKIFRLENTTTITHHARTRAASSARRVMPSFR